MDFLFDRLETSPPQVDSLVRQRDAVRRQLQWLVGSREWRSEKEGLGLLEVAMPELPTLGADGSQLQRYAARLKRLIERHEPRLRQPQVKLQGTGRTLTPFTVVVSGMLDTKNGGEELKFEYEPGPRHSR